jgi:putative ABC transport system permease protein
MAEAHPHGVPESEPRDDARAPEPERTIRIEPPVPRDDEETRWRIGIGETLGVAIDALRANKLRASLTMLGIIIGVAAVIAMVALGRGAQESVNERIASLGTTLLTVTPGQRFSRGVATADTRAKLTLDDVTALDTTATSITAIEPEMTRNLQIQYRNTNTNTSIIGTSANYPEVRKYEIEYGRMFTTAEDEATQRVIVLGAQIPQDLGQPPQAMLGEAVRVMGIQFTVIGILASKGQTGGFQNPDDQALVPVRTARYRLFGSDQLRSINVLAPSEAQIPQAMADVQRVLRRSHRLRPSQDDDFSIRSQADFLNTLGETTAVFTYLLAGIAAVSLLVGGIGIMNIMLVSVTERTREIGVRKALGARRKDILLQFLIESIVLCMLGGLGGIALGTLAASLLSTFAGWTTSIAPASILMAFAFSAGVGILFGVWPARRAAALDPIQSLRYE